MATIYVDPKSKIIAEGRQPRHLPGQRRELSAPTPSPTATKRPKATKEETAAKRKAARAAKKGTP